MLESRSRTATFADWYNPDVGNDEIIAQLPHLTPADRAEVQAKLDELAGDAWQDRGELSELDKQVLDKAIANYERFPDSGLPWDQVKGRVQATLRRRPCP